MSKRTIAEWHWTKHEITFHKSIQCAKGIFSRTAFHFTALISRWTTKELAKLTPSLPLCSLGNTQVYFLCRWISHKDLKRESFWRILQSLAKRLGCGWTSPALPRKRILRNSPASKHELLITLEEAMCLKVKPPRCPARFWSAQSKGSAHRGSNQS